MHMDDGKRIVTCICWKEFENSNFTVPNDLLEMVVWSLEMFIKVLEESSEAQLRAMGHITRSTPANKVELAKETMVSGTMVAICCAIPVFSVSYRCFTYSDTYFHQFLNAKMKVANHML